MVRLNATAFLPSLITSFTSDEARREAVISRMCERPGFDREKVENVLDLLREVVEERASDDAPKPTPELRMALAQQVAELSGRTVREVLEDDVSNDGGGVATGVGGMVGLRRAVARWWWRDIIGAGRRF